MDALAREVVHAARTLAKSVALTLAAVVTLALGIGSTTAIFSVVDSVLLRPLPFPGAEQLVVPQSHSRLTGESWSVSHADFMDWRDQRVFDRVAVYQNTEADLTGVGEPVCVSAVAVSPQFFGALGLAPALGRPLQPGDFDPAAPRGVVLSDRLWRTQFGAQQDAVGRTIELNGIRRPIVGVMPAGARWPVDVDVWVPLRITDEADPDLQRRDNYVFSAIARLDPARGLEGEVDVQWNVSTPGYLAALGVPLLRGRDFTALDDSTGTPVMIVNEEFVRAMFPHDEPVGKRAMSSRDEKVYREIVGVVGNVKYYGASDSARALAWVPYAQNPWGMGIVTVRTSGMGAATALPAVRRELRELDPGIALANVMTMDEARARSMAGDRLVAILLGTFAALALTLAAVGVFGVLSYQVERRSRELGIRIALGAQRGQVVRVVAGDMVPMLAGGIGLGLLAAAGLTRVVRSLLYEVQPVDPLTFGGVALVLGLVGVVAALVPVRRAMQVDPVTVLRAE